MSTKRQQWDGNFRVKAAATRRIPRVLKQLKDHGIEATVAVEPTTCPHTGSTIYQVIATYEETAS